MECSTLEEAIKKLEVGKNADLVLLIDAKSCVIEEVYKNGEIIDEDIALVANEIWKMKGGKIYV